MCANADAQFYSHSCVVSRQILMILLSQADLNTIENSILNIWVTLHLRVTKIYLTTLIKNNVAISHVPTWSLVTRMLPVLFCLSRPLWSRFCFFNQCLLYEHLTILILFIYLTIDKIFKIFGHDYFPLIHFPSESWKCSCHGKSFFPMLHWGLFCIWQIKCHRRHSVHLFKDAS